MSPYRASDAAAEDLLNNGSTPRSVHDYRDGPGAYKTPRWSDTVADGFGIVSFLRVVRVNFGGRLMFLLFVAQHLSKGFAYKLAGLALPYLYVSYHVPADQAQIFTGISGLPWSLKPIIGLMSDMLPMFGYNKSPYMVISAIGGLLGILYMSILSHDTVSPIGIVVAMFFYTCQVSTCDILSEAKYAETMNRAPKHGPAILTFVWCGLTVGGLVAVVLCGYLVSQHGPKFAMLICMFPCGLVLVAVLMGYMDESWVSPEEIARTREHFYKQKEVCFLCVLMFAGSMTIFVMSILYPDPWITFIVSISVSVIVLVCCSVVLTPVIAKFNAFALIAQIAIIPTSGASFYFYTDTALQYPAGPHFSPYFFNTVMGTVAQLCSMAGVVLYQRHLKNWKYRHLLIASNFVYFLLNCLDAVVFARLNIAWGIPDHVCVLGLAAFENILYQWSWMPQVVILSYLCPKGMEATMYALLAGCHNLGNTVSYNLGALVLQQFHVQPMGTVGDAEQLENLWKASATAAALPFLTIMCLYKLVPDAHQNQKLMRDTDYDATSGSLWRRWMYETTGRTPRFVRDHCC